ncbi:hypothetical protein PSKM_gp70 [Pantoea phage vB_PagM_PSKM]|uniref:Uncharacterized protein n=1 Tax=Pantoea phage vB_PagM_PSKM TaxID=2588094 RepID=A0A513ZYR8_9CAUD|nr:hypothetical protein HWC23_gp70 [Pantoea phage vB_PagM_PSKM]QDH45827.1 hypothetical protein PSKM_gp70 [Pantoea phage vB_PagM_PSKM]
MKQQNKYLIAYTVSLAVSLSGALLSDHHIVWLSVWLVGCGFVWASVRGYVDSRYGDNPSYMIDRYGAMMGLKRRFYGLEYDSAYQRRITRQVMRDRRK